MGSGSKSSGGSGGGAGGGVQGTGTTTATMPPETKKMVQRLKEIVSNFTESEIYAMLKECNMDPDAAIQRLLAQDTFHEVKSKRERRKETKETQDTRCRSNNIGSNYGVKGASERNHGQSGTMYTSPNDYGNAAYKRENESASPTLHSSSSFAPCAAGKTSNQQVSSQGNFFSVDDGKQSAGTGDGILSSVQQHPGFQSAWLGGTTGQVSMADIVKMGRSQNKVSQNLTETPQDAVASYASDYDIKAPPNSAPVRNELCFQNPSHAPERINESSNYADQHVSYDEWPVIEQSATTTGSSVLDVSTAPDAEIYSNQSNLYSDGGNMSRNYRLDDVQASNGDVARQDCSFDLVKSASASSRQNFLNNAGEASHFGNGTLKDMNSCIAVRSTYERPEGSGTDIPFSSHSVSLTDGNITTVSSAAEELENLSLGKEDYVKSTKGDNCTVVFPNNLQALAADCSHLSFGTYKSSNGTAFSGPPTLNSRKSNMDEASAAMDGSSVGGLDTRYLGYHADGQIGSFYHKAMADGGSYHLPVSSQPELMKESISETTYGHEYISPLSVPDSSFDNIPQQNSALPFAKADRIIRNQPSFPSEALSYSNSRQTDLLASTVESLRDSDHRQLAFLASQSLPSRHGGAVSSIGSPTISMSEVLKSGTFLPQLNSQTVPSAMGSGLQQHFAAHPYPQSSLNVEQLANMIGYPSVVPQSQSYPYKQSSVQESYAGGSSLQSLADMKYALQQYKSGASLNNLPLANANANASGYAGYGNSTNVPGSFLHNPSIAPAATNNDGYDLFLSQYKDASHFNPLRQNDNPAWDFAAGSRTMPSVPNSAYYSLQAQNQQHVGYRQNQQSSQHYGALGYLDFYHSQTGIPQEYQQQQSFDDLTLDSQIPSSKQLQQIWQKRY